MQQLKNDDQRKAFLHNVERWGVWLEVPELTMRFFRYDLPDGSYIIASQCRLSEYNAKLTHREWTSPTLHLVKVRETYSTGVNSTTDLIAHLKQFKEV